MKLVGNSTSQSLHFDIQVRRLIKKIYFKWVHYLNGYISQAQKANMKIRKHTNINKYIKLHTHSITYIKQTYANKYINTHMHTHTHAHTHAHKHARTRKNTATKIRVNTNTQTHKKTYRHTYTHTYTNLHILTTAYMYAFKLRKRTNH